jgi:hypothetical protein
VGCSMTNCERISNAVRPYPGQALAAGKIISLVLSMYPSTNPTSIIPSDHSGPNPRSGRSVLSLNRTYDSFVVPRLDRFEQNHSSIRTIADLQKLIADYSSAPVFVARCLDYNDDARSVTLSKVVDWLVKVADDGDYDTQMSNLLRWASNSKPEDHFRLGIAGFGLGGFQYLRMLFGANTTKPDVHIQRYVASCVGHRVSDVQALALLESAAAEADVSLRDLDTTIWERSARANCTDRFG